MKTLAELSRHPNIKWIDDERRLGNGIIITLQGLALDPHEDENQATHVFAEDTFKQVVDMLKQCKPCTCNWCVTVTP